MKEIKAIILGLSISGAIIFGIVIAPIFYSILIAAKIGMLLADVLRGQ